MHQIKEYTLGIITSITTAQIFDVETIRTIVIILIQLLLTTTIRLIFKNKEK